MEHWLQSLVPWGTQVIISVQAHSPAWLTGLAKGFTFLGYEEFYLVLLPFVYWCLHKQIGAALVYFSLLSAWVNDTIKYIFRIPRPANPNIHVPLGFEETSPSFPSGHAQNAVANWGYLAYRFRNWLFRIVAVVVILCIGLSRIVLGVHFPEDVIGGWLIGLVLLVLYAWAAPPVSRWIGRQKVAVQVALAIIIPAGLIFLHPADNQGLYPAEGSITPMSTLVGVGIGLIMEQARLRFRVDGAWWLRGLRLAVGLAILGIFYAVPKLILPENLAYGPEALVRFVRYALVGWTVAFLCPWIFVRLHLAGQEAPAQRVDGAPRAA
jgi:membrane-associated phospholipid phosphatase